MNRRGIAMDRALAPLPHPGDSPYGGHNSFGFVLALAIPAGGTGPGRELRKGANRTGGSHEKRVIPNRYLRASAR